MRFFDAEAGKKEIGNVFKGDFGIILRFLSFSVTVDIFGLQKVMEV